MAAEIIGSVRSGRTHRSIRVKWDHVSHDTYIEWAGWTYVGKAHSPSHAMRMAEAFLYDK